MNTRSVTTRDTRGNYTSEIYDQATGRKIATMRGDMSGNSHMDSYDANGRVSSTSDHVVTRDDRNRLTSAVDYRNGKQDSNMQWEYRDAH